MTDADGRAGQEAARLLAAAQDWLRTSAPHLAPVGEDGEPCSCPLCRAVVSLRDTDPDSVARWVDSAVAGVSAALAQAATLATERTTGGAGEGGDGHADDAAGTSSTSGEADPGDGDVGHDGGAGSRVRRIPLDGDVGPDLH